MTRDNRFYHLGKDHGINGIRHLAHRRGVPYQIKSVQLKYTEGYKAGYAIRLESGKSGLDYSNKLNNQVFLSV